MRLLVVMCCLAATISCDRSAGGTLTCDPCTCHHDDKYGGLYVTCSGLNITIVPRFLPSAATTLLLNKNHITSLPNRAFYWLTNLRELDLSGNNFTSLLDPDVFVGLRQLLLLNIDNIVLTDCNFTLTDNFIKLQYLEPLINLQTLSALNLRFLNCAFIPPSLPPLFHNVYIANSIPQTLQHLYIDCMSCLFSESFSSLSNLTHVAVSNSAGSGLCILYEIQNVTFQSLIHVKSLNLSGCRIRYLNPGVFSSLKDLCYLDIRFKTLLTSEKKSLFYNATMSLSRKIEVIRYTYHEETNLDKSVFTFLQNTSLTELYFNAHLMTMIEDDAFFYLPKKIEVLSSQKFLFKSDFTLWVVKKLSFLRKLDLSDSLLRDDVSCLLDFIPQRIETYICANCRCRTMEELPNYFNLNNSISHLNLVNTDIGRVFKKENKNLYKHFTSFISLDVSSNHLWFLPQDIFLYSKHLRVLNLSDNLLQTLDFALSSLTHLETFDLSNNKINVLRSSTRKDLETMPNVSVRLQGNPLSCSCEELDFLQWIQHHRSNIFELSQLSCRMSGDRKISFSHLDDVVHQLEEQCKSNVVEISVSVSIVVSFLAVMAACLGYRNRWKLRYLYHVGRRGYRRRQLLGYEDDFYQYDAFVSYADEDRKFVIESMMPELEGKCDMKLCIHHRDFLPGEVIATNIVNAIQNSRKTLIVLSPSFLRSSWCEYEYNMARMEGVSRRQEVVLVVLYDYVSIRDLPKDMAVMFRRNCYLEYNEDMFGNEVFWQNVEESIRTSIPQD